MFKNKRVLVTGGTGMIGSYLTKLLLDRKAEVHVASLDDSSRSLPGSIFHYADLTSFETCKSLCFEVDYVFHLAGPKGSPWAAHNKPASFFVPILMCTTNMMEAARLNGVKWYLQTSSMGVYGPAKVFYESDVWNSMPSKNDWFAGWAKRMGELQAEAYKKEYNWDQVSIVRPGNVYGNGDSFEPKTAMVIPSLIRRVVEGENPLRVQGRYNVRDFIHARDVARQMVFCVENKVTESLNSASGKPTTIEELVKIVVNCINPKTEVVWEDVETNSDNVRLLDMGKANLLGFYPETTLENGIKETVDWYMENRDMLYKRYDSFKKEVGK